MPNLRIERWFLAATPSSLGYRSKQGRENEKISVMRRSVESQKRRPVSEKGSWTRVAFQTYRAWGPAIGFNNFEGFWRHLRALSLGL